MLIVINSCYPLNLFLPNAKSLDRMKHEKWNTSAYKMMFRTIFTQLFFVISTDDIKDTVGTEREMDGNVCTDDVKHLDVEVTNSGSDKECGKLISIY